MTIKDDYLIIIKIFQYGEGDIITSDYTYYSYDRIKKKVFLLCFIL